MAPQYKLSYFEGRGIVEPIRYMFAYKEVEYEDNRVIEKDWPALKPNYPFRKLPTLEFDGKILTESSAIGRYVAKELGLYGKTDFEGATIDMYIDALRDNFTQIRTFKVEQDAEKKAEFAKKYYSEILPPFLDAMEKNLKKNGGVYYVGNELTWADFSFGYAVSEFRKYNAEVIGKYPVVCKHADYIHTLAQIDAWVAKRPQTEF